MIDLAEVQQVEIGYCARCRSVVEMTTDGPFGYGRTIERCTNPRCIGSAPHAPRPEPTYRTPSNPSPHKTGEYKSSRTAALLAKNAERRKVRAAEIAGTGLSLEVSSDFANLS